jgi:hypothetical protein
MQLYSHFILIIQTEGLKVKRYTACSHPLGHHQENVFRQNCHTVYLKSKYSDVFHVAILSSAVLV